MTATLSHRCLAPVDAGASLMLRIQRDEPGAFDELVSDWRARIFARFLHLFRDRQEAEDLTQEVFLRLYRSRKSYQPRARFTTWLFHITQNVARNALRRRRRHAWLQLGYFETDGETDAAPAADEPSRPLEQRELAETVRAAVGELAGRQRTALELHHFGNRSYAEIADELDLTPEATKSLLYRARLQLRQYFERLPALA